VTLYEKTGEIFLDLAPTLKLFGGETALLITVEELVDAFELDAYQVLTDRPEWARALALKRYVEIPPGQSQARLLELPLERLMGCGDPNEAEDSLHCRHELIRFMQRVGLKRIGDFASLSQSAVGRRFGQKGVQLLEWTLGKRELCLPLFSPEESIVETIPTNEIVSLDALLFLLRQLLVRVEARLVGRAQAARQLSLTFYLASGQRKTERFTFSEPLREAQSLLRLLREFLNHSTPPWDSPLESLILTVSDTSPFTAGQLSLFDEGENRYANLAEYIARLRARYGEEQVGFPRLRESYLPERSWENLWQPSPSTPDSPLPERPLFLFSPARPCTPLPQWQLTPSENLAVEWWEEGGNRRYYTADTPDGKRLWIYWDGQRNAWFLHGTFD